VRLNSGFRSAISFAVAVLVIFNQGHYVELSLIALAAFGLLLGITQIFLSLFAKQALTAIEIVPLAVISFTVGALALLVLLQNQTMRYDPALTTEEFRWLVTGWAVTTGAFELYLARRMGIRTPFGRDQLITSLMTLTLGIVFLVLPLDRTTTVGLFATYLAISAVHLGISAAGPKHLESETADSAK
jgi:hypothetical protein